MNINNTTAFNPKVYKTLPKLLIELLSLIKHDREKDIVLLSLLGCFGAAFEKVRGMYRDEWLHPSLFLFITSTAAEGKGIIKIVRNLFAKYHNSIRKKTEGIVSFFIPGNSSQAALFDTLYNNNGTGVLFESEADVISNSFKQDWGSTSSDLRCAYHHETISRRRVNDNCAFEIERPRYSIVLSGTRNQIPTLFRNTEDGLFSRFLFYCFFAKDEFDDVRPTRKESLSFYFNKYHERIEGLIYDVNSIEPVIWMTDEQWDTFIKEFRDRHEMILKSNGSSAKQIIRRNAVGTFKILMILTVLRNENSIEKKLLCSDSDLKIALQISNTLLEHSMIVFESFKGVKEFILSDHFLLRLDVLENLSDNFSTKDMEAEFESFGIHRSQAHNYRNKWINSMYIKKINKGNYEKLNKAKVH